MRTISLPVRFAPSPGELEQGRSPVASRRRSSSQRSEPKERSRLGLVRILVTRAPPAASRRRSSSQLSERKGRSRSGLVRVLVKRGSPTASRRRSSKQCRSGSLPSSRSRYGLAHILLKRVLREDALQASYLSVKGAPAWAWCVFLAKRAPCSCFEKTLLESI